jgi:hypothetical protein
LRDLEINSDVLGANIAIHLLAMGWLLRNTWLGGFVTVGTSPSAYT